MTFSLLAFGRLCPTCRTKRKRRRQTPQTASHPRFFPFAAKRGSRLPSAARRNKDVSPVDLFMACRYAAPEQSAATGSLHFYKWTLKGGEGGKKKSELCDCRCFFQQHPGRQQQARCQRCAQSPRGHATAWQLRGFGVVGIKSSRAMEMIGTLVTQTVSSQRLRRQQKCPCVGLGVTRCLLVERTETKKEVEISYKICSFE